MYLNSQIKANIKYKRSVGLAREKSVLFCFAVSVNTCILYEYLILKAIQQ